MNNVNCMHRTKYTGHHALFTNLVQSKEAQCTIVKLKAAVAKMVKDAQGQNLGPRDVEFAAELNLTEDSEFTQLELFKAVSVRYNHEHPPVRKAKAKTPTA